VLTQTQTEETKTEELKPLEVRLEAGLERRRRESEREASENREVLEVHDTPKETYQWEMVERGHRKRSNKRKSGEWHGPYLYRYRDGKRESDYIKLANVERLGFSRPAVRTAK
jgi:hypothetical protein